MEVLDFVGISNRGIVEEIWVIFWLKNLSYWWLIFFFFFWGGKKKKEKERDFCAGFVLDFDWNIFWKLWKQCFCLTLYMVAMKLEEIEWEK